MKNYKEIYTSVKSELAIQHNIIIKDDDPEIIAGYIQMQIIAEQLKEINSLTSTMSNDYSLTMKQLFDKWKNEAEKENTRMLEQNIHIHNRKIEEIIEQHLFSQGLKFYEKLDNKVQLIFDKKISYIQYLYFFLCCIVFILGVLIGKFLL